MVRKPALTVLVLALLLGIQPVTTDLYLPALPALADALAADMAQAQLTLGALLLAFGVSQLALGPLSDRFGRRPVLLAGLSVYVAAAIGSTLAGSIEWLIVWRTLQGAAMGAAVVCARAIVRDLYLPADGARVMSRAAHRPRRHRLRLRAAWRPRPPMPSAGAPRCCCWPCSAPARWHCWRCASTKPCNGRDPDALAPTRQAATWATVLRHPTFLAFTALTTRPTACCSPSSQVPRSSSSTCSGSAATQYGLVMLWNSGCISPAPSCAASGWRATALPPRWRAARCCRWPAAARWACWPLPACGGVAAVVAPFTLAMLGHGIHQPCGQTGAVGPFPHAAGAAAALNGFS